MTYRIPGLLVFCLGLSSAGAGCTVADDGGASLGGPPRSTLGAGTGTATSVMDDMDLTGGSLVPYMDAVQAVYTNGLSAEALTRNALITNLRANRAMVMLPLATETYADDSEHEELLEHAWRLDPELLRYRLRHKETREVMGYLVSCALEQGQSVSYTDTRTGKTYEFPGEIGICPHWNEQGVHEGPAGAKCRQLITACLLALVNPTGRRITVSLRGQAFPNHRPGLLSPGPSVRVGTTTEDDAAIPSFGSCKSDTRGLSRNCGWTAEHVGTCSPGSTVTLGARGTPVDECDHRLPVAPGRSDDDTILRVCDGIHGCNAGSPAHVAQTEVRCSDRSEPALRFECPSSGYFSVMSGPLMSRRASGAPGKDGAPAPRKLAGFSVASRPPTAGPMPIGAGIVVEPAPFQPAVYPAQEADIFGWREGAFYGNFWTETNPLHEKLTPEMNEVDEEGNLYPAPRSGAVVFRHAFACTGEHWDDEIAYQKDRLCAGGDEDEDCVAHSVGACGDSYNITNCPPLHQCDLEDGGLVEGDGDFQECAGDGGTWLHPITSFLNDPVDVVRRPWLPVPGMPTPGGSGTSPLLPLCP
ncbi:hypothetical protein [Sorangium cellulosum]|uniref:Secreted protein n=1 Tax=Sorangium cellulosum TaxID=56 RepID=A0A150QKL8_SORCE|nr:hypothetical protein [Sorangium cellulosum]KYF68493.1 hypothetical protein BE15_32930 [Sorangium cellulosum]